MLTSTFPSTGTYGLRWRVFPDGAAATYTLTCTPAPPITTTTTTTAAGTTTTTSGETTTTAVSPTTGRATTVVPPPNTRDPSPDR